MQSWRRQTTRYLRGLIELSQTTKKRWFMFSWDFLGGQIYTTWQDFPDAKKCQEDVQVLCFGTSMGHDQQKHQKKIMAKSQFHERLWGQWPMLYLQQRKRSTIRNTFLGFLPPLTTSCEDFQQTETIVSQLKNTLGHLRLWQSIARIWTQEKKTIKICSKKRVLPPLLKAPLSRWFFLLSLGGICDRFPVWYVQSS